MGLLEVPGPIVLPARPSADMPPRPRRSRFIGTEKDTGTRVLETMLPHRLRPGTLGTHSPAARVAAIHTAGARNQSADDTQHHVPPPLRTAHTGAWRQAANPTQYATQATMWRIAVEPRDYERYMRLG